MKCPESEAQEGSLQGQAELVEQEGMKVGTPGASYQKQLST